MSMPPGKTTYTLAQAAQLLSCHRETLRRAIRNGELRAAKLGRGFRISRVDLETFWMSSGGGDLFGTAAEENVQSSPVTDEPTAAKKNKGSQQRRQEQFSLLHPQEAEAGKRDD